MRCEGAPGSGRLNLGWAQSPWTVVTSASPEMDSTGARRELATSSMPEAWANSTVRPALSTYSDRRHRAHATQYRRSRPRYTGADGPGGEGVHRRGSDVGGDQGPGWPTGGEAPGRQGVKISWNFTILPLYTVMSAGRRPDFRREVTTLLEQRLSPKPLWSTVTSVPLHPVAL